MKVDVTKVLKTLSGQNMRDIGENNDAVDATLKLVIVNALLAPEKKSETGVDKIKKYELAKRVFNSETVELSAEEISLIKTRIGEIYPALVVGQAFEMLEGK